MAELRDLYDINSNKTDKTYRKGEPIPNGYDPMVVMVVIRNSKGEFFTFQSPHAGQQACKREIFAVYDTGCDTYRKLLALSYVVSNERE